MFLNLYEAKHCSHRVKESERGEALRHWFKHSLWTCLMVPRHSQGAINSSSSVSRSAADLQVSFSVNDRIQWIKLVFLPPVLPEFTGRRGLGAALRFWTTWQMRQILAHKLFELELESKSISDLFRRNIFYLKKHAKAKLCLYLHCKTVVHFGLVQKGP